MSENDHKVLLSQVENSQHSLNKTEIELLEMLKNNHHQYDVIYDDLKLKQIQIDNIYKFLRSKFYDFLGLLLIEIY